jgi:hypothetical protein
MILGVLGLVAAELAFSEAEIVNGVQQVGFAAAVAPGDANDAPAETVSPVRIVLELGKRYVSNR